MNSSTKLNDFRKLENCRLCDSNFFPEVLNLNDSPLANELYPTFEEAKSASRFPLNVVMCSGCKHVQLREIVSPERMFANYLYQSGTSQSFRRHFDELAQLISVKFDNRLVVEIGSNDGTLLKNLGERGIPAVGVEPSKLLVDNCTKNKMNVKHGFLDKKMVFEILTHYGPAEVVVGNNVFAHIDDLKSAFICVGELLEDNGFFVFEVAHLLKLIEKKLFDSIYHEHMSYHSIIALIPLLNETGFTLVDVEEVDTHGGSIRVTAQKGKGSSVAASVEELLKSEISAGLDTPDIFKKMKIFLKSLENEINQVLNLTENSQTIIGYGAPAKVVTFLSEMMLEELNIVGIVDDNPDKQNKFLPGSGFRILSADAMQTQLGTIHTQSTEQIVKCLIFPWNLSAEILPKIRSLTLQKIDAICFSPAVSVVSL